MMGTCCSPIRLAKSFNVQIRVETISGMVAALREQEIALYLEPEDKWYRIGDVESGNRQFVVADPDGYLLRFFEELGERSCQG